MPKSYKVEQVAELKGKFEESNDFIVADYRGLSVQEITELRTRLYEHNVSFKVVKNNLACIALKDLGLEGYGDYFTGPTSVAFTGAEAPAAAKILAEYQSKTSLEIKAGYIDGTFFGSDGVVEISKLPGKQVLLSQIAGGMMGILSRFAGDMQSVLSTFALTLKAVEDKKAAG